ncbi:hypothetical protein BHE74_00045546 [Ensete ventricosum]|nr:hypothetical protein BHE74_00045546 [Ensete ventricosum]RZS18058.1 hypothetical protein BHM03_00050293 [Ensete ventricosum]
MLAIRADVGSKAHPTVLSTVFTVRPSRPTPPLSLRVTAVSGKVSSGPGVTMATVAGQALLQCVFDRCIAAFDTEVRRRPYHRNCGCALHRSGRSPEGLPCNGRVSFRIRPSGGDLAASTSVSGGLKTESWKTKPPPYVAK